MSNNRLAKKVLSVILEKDILELELSQQEMVVEGNTRMFTLYRLDFKARVLDENGKEETVLIELQKSNLPSNVLRFRSCLGLAYAQTTKVPNAQGEDKDTAYPIVAIYILGYNVVDIPVMAAKIDHRITDMSAHQELHIESDFIDMVTHTCHILQVRRLPAERRTRIEQFMSLFNQAWVKEADYILDLLDVPEEFRDIAEYLQGPLLDEEIYKKLREEKEMRYYFAKREAHIKQLEEEIEQAQAQVKKAQVEKANARAERGIAQADGIALKYARFLLRSGLPSPEAAQETELGEDVLRELAES